MRETITGNIWNYVDIDKINYEVDKKVGMRDDNRMACDITYKIKKIDKAGNFEIEAKFTLD